MIRMNKGTDWRGGCARKLKIERVKRDMTQEEFAEEIGVNDSTYKKTEREVLPASIDLLLHVKRYTGYTIDYFLSDARSELDRAWSLVADCSDMDKIIIFMKLVNELGIDRCTEIIKNCKEESK